jgi:hypothetical protein
MAGTDPSSTSSSWPGWTYESWVHYFEDKWPPFLIGAPGLETREDFIDSAWQHPLGPEGLQSSFHLAIEGLVNDEKVAAAQRWQSTIHTQTGSTNYSIGTAMAALIVPGVFLCAIKMQNGGRDVINVVGVRNSSGSASGAATAVSTAWQVSNGPLGQLSNLIQFTNVHSMDISTANGAIADLALTGKTGSVSATNSLSTAAASALIKWNGGTRSGTSRGRLYYGPLMEQNIDTTGRLLLSGSQTAYQTAFTNFRNSLDTSGYPLVVVSRKNNSATAVTSHAVESTIATQRRRIRS